LFVLDFGDFLSLIFFLLFGLESLFMSLIKLDLLIIDAFVIVEDEMVSDVFIPLFDSVILQLPAIDLSYPINLPLILAKTAFIAKLM